MFRLSPCVTAAKASARSTPLSAQARPRYARPICCARASQTARCVAPVPQPGCRHVPAGAAARVQGALDLRRDRGGEPARLADLVRRPASLLRARARLPRPARPARAHLAHQPGHDAQAARGRLGRLRALPRAARGGRRQHLGAAAAQGGARDGRPGRQPRARGRGAAGQADRAGRPARRGKVDAIQHRRRRTS